MALARHRGGCRTGGCRAPAGVLAGGAPARETAAAVRSVAPPGTPNLTNPKALMVAARAGDVLVGAQAAPGEVRVVAIPPDVRRLPRAAVRARLRVGARYRRVTRPCGWNCVALRADEIVAGRATRLLVEVKRGARTVRTALALPARMPPSGGRLLAQLNRRMNRLRTVRIRQVLSNGVSALRSTWLYQAPDRTSYVASNGTRGVIIGERRWDYFAGRWTARSTPRLRSPRYMWAGAARARALGTATVRGRTLRVVSVFRPNGSYPSFFTLYVARDGTVVESRMLAPAHFMVDRLDRFDAPIEIRPPE